MHYDSSKSFESSRRTYPDSVRSKLHLCDHVYEVGSVLELHNSHVQITSHTLGVDRLPLIQTRAIIPSEELPQFAEQTHQIQIEDYFTYPAAAIVFKNPSTQKDLALVYAQSFVPGRHEIIPENLHSLANRTLVDLRNHVPKEKYLPEGYSIKCLTENLGYMVDCDTGEGIFSTSELAFILAEMYTTQFGTLHYAGLSTSEYHIDALSNNPFFAVLDENQSLAAFAQLEIDQFIDPNITGLRFYEGTWLTSVNHRRMGLSHLLRIEMGRRAKEGTFPGLIYTESRYKDSFPASIRAGWQLACYPISYGSDRFNDLSINGNIGPYVAVANHDTQMGVTYILPAQAQP